MVKKPEVPLPQTSDDFRSLAANLRIAMTKFEDMADELDSSGIKSVEVLALTTREKMLVWLTRAVNHASNAVNAAVIRSHAAKSNIPIVGKPTPQQRQKHLQDAKEVERNLKNNTPTENNGADKPTKPTKGGKR